MAARAGAHEERALPVPPQPARQANDRPDPGRTETPRPVGLLLNGGTLPEPVMVAGSGDRLLLRQSDLSRILTVPPGAMVGETIAGEPYVLAASLAGLSAKLSDDGTLLLLTADPGLFPVSRIGPQALPLRLNEAVPAAFISYDVNYLRWNGRDTVSAFVDGGTSGPWGVLGTTLLVQDQSRPVIRLDTAFQRDFPDDRVRLVVGDTFTRGAEWNLPARFAGIRIGTDFSLQPQVVNFPLPALSGSAAEPSIVDLLSAGARQSFAVQPGNFMVDFQPVFSGAGAVTMMITDSAGMSRQITRDFYTSPRLLRPGLGEFSIEAGVLRENHGVRSFDYSDPFLAAFGRYGVTDRLTLSGRIEASPGLQMAGAGVGWVLGQVGEFSLSGAVSDSASGRGTFARAQFQRIARTHSFTVSYQRDNGRFAPVGSPALISPRAGMPRSELALAGTISLGTIGDISVGHIDARTSDGARFRTSTASFAGTWVRVFYNLGVRQQDSAVGRDHGAFVSVSVSLGRRGNANLRVDEDRLLASAGRVPPNDQGIGFQVAAGREAGSGSAILSASALVRTVAGDFELAADRNPAGSGIRASARGALVAVGGKVAATPRIETGFALVELESEEAVTLYLENRPMVVKGGKGRQAILTGLQPYVENQVAIDLGALPIDAQIAAPEQMVVPGFRQAARVRFGGAKGSPATLAFVGADGAPVAAGLDVFVGTQLVGRSGFDGLVFFPDLPSGATVSIRGTGYACDAKLPDKSANQSLMVATPIVCGAVLAEEKNR
ncbi:MAG: fimbria/pilus outer membrane usher protein [Porphyrobacter sp.]|nr:fimbria/pilus outer membrane usher protein [Porphyrobacter sp.]